MIELRRSAQSTTHAYINGGNFGGIASASELREMASPEWAERCKRLADEIEGRKRPNMAEAVRDCERASERLRAAQAAREQTPPTERSVVPQKRDKS